MDPNLVESIVSRTASVPVRPGTARGTNQGVDSNDTPFSAVLERATASTASGGSVTTPVKISAHASQRMTQRGYQFSHADLLRIGQAIDKAGSKGVRDAYVLYGDAGLVVSVPNRTVITAMSSREDSIITNVDSVVVIQRPDQLGGSAMGTD